MKTNTLIIGGGLTGLSLAYRLQSAGHDFQLVEARARFGGRIKSLRVNDHAFDLGPSWIWPGQNRIAAFLQDLGLESFEQWSAGAQLYQHPNGEVTKDTGFMSMAGSYRIAGGTSALIDALVARLDPQQLHVNMPVTEIKNSPHAICADGTKIEANRIIVAVPPRVAGAINYSPALTSAAMDTLNSVPTWMGAHAKFVAVYESPFWRDAGLSGDASSRRGPLAEIHDASPQDGDLGALFGFVGLPAQVRAEAGQDTVIAASIDQLTNLFGPQAAHPKAVQLEDWSAAPFTATQADADAPRGHPPYGMQRPLLDVWDGRLQFSVTELTGDNGGLIEGALAASEHAANAILKL